MNEILRLFPEHLRSMIHAQVNKNWNSLQEIRIRLYQPIELMFNDQIIWLDQTLPNENDGIFILNQLSEFSLYRLEDELREGYITIEGGHRVGLAGKVNTENGNVKALSSITFFNIRIAKENIGVAETILPFMVEDNRYVSTLIIGPPQAGKTTLIRDLTRMASSGWRFIKPYKVGVIDERSEIGASIKGIPQHQLGPRTDVLDACPKADGMMMMIRSMSPDILVVDEIGSKKDVDALLEAINAGVVVFCTIHGQTLEDLKKRPSIKPILDEVIFKRFILLKRSMLPGHIAKVFNENHQPIYKNRGA